MLDARGTCLIIDAHSFPSFPFRTRCIRTRTDQDSCIGTADFHTPAELSEMVVRLCRHAGWTIAVNKPFAGAPVPMPYFRADARVRAVMTEVNRPLYLNGASTTRGVFDSCRSKLCTVMGDLIDESFVRRD